MPQTAPTTGSQRLLQALNRAALLHRLDFVTNVARSDILILLLLCLETDPIPPDRIDFTVHLERTLHPSNECSVPIATAE
jgi:hypothetical protein